LKMSGPQRSRVGVDAWPKVTMMLNVPVMRSAYVLMSISVDVESPAPSVAVITYSPVLIAETCIEVEKEP